ncbi:Obg family GTPase CgtA, partial [Thomasclavelia cocleata]|uniref:Obg family GTPase CgtA n=1 Tax=Thomasclavelia cocleata TaxID=69824 RepID=UPI0024323E7C
FNIRFGTKDSWCSLLNTGMVAMTSLVSDDSLKRLLIKLRNMGVDEALRDAGAKDGDNVTIADFEFDYFE